MDLFVCGLGDVLRALLHFLQPAKFPNKDEFVAKYKDLHSEKEVGWDRMGWDALNRKMLDWVGMGWNGIGQERISPASQSFWGVFPEVFF